MPCELCSGTEAALLSLTSELKSREHQLEEVNAKFSKYKLQSKAKVTQLRQQLAELIIAENQLPENEESSQSKFSRVLLKLDDAETDLVQCKEDTEKLKTTLASKDTQIADHLIRIKLLEEQLELTDSVRKHAEVMERNVELPKQQQSDIHASIYAQLVYKDTKILELNNQILAKDRQILDLQESCRERQQVADAKSKAIQILQNEIVRMSPRDSHDASTETGDYSPSSVSAPKNIAMPVNRDLSPSSSSPGHAVAIVELPRSGSPPPADPALDEMSSLTTESAVDLVEFIRTDRRVKVQITEQAEEASSSATISALKSRKRASKKRVTFDLSEQERDRELKELRQKLHDLEESNQELRNENEELRSTIGDVEIALDDAKSLESDWELKCKLLESQIEKTNQELEDAKREGRNNALKAKAQAQAKTMELEEQLEELIVQKNDALERLTHLEEQLKDTKYVNEDLLEEIDLLRNKLDDSRENVGKLNDIVRNLEKENISLRDQIDEMDSMNESLEEQKEKILANIDPLKETVDTSNQLIDSLEGEIKALKEEVAEREEQINELTANLEEARNTADALLRQKQSLFIDADSLKEAVEASQQVIESLETDLEIANAESDVLRENLYELQHETGEVTAELERESTEKKLKGKAFETKLRILEQRKHELAKESSEHRLRWKAFDVKLRTITQAKQDLEAQFQVEKQRKEELESQNKSLISELEKSNAHTQALEQKVEQLKSKLESETQRVKESEKSVRFLNDEKSDIERELKDYWEAETELKRKLGEAEETCDRLRSERRKWQTHITELETSENALIQQVAFQTETIQKRDQECQKLNDRVAVLESGATEVTKEFAKELSTLRVHFNAVDTKNKDLKAENGDLQQKLAMVQNENAKLASLAETKEAQIETMESGHQMQVTGLLRDIDSWRISSDKQQYAIQELQESVAHLRETNTSIAKKSEESIFSHETEKKTLQAENEILSGELEKVKTANESLQEELKVLKSKEDGHSREEEIKFATETAEKRLESLRVKLEFLFQEIEDFDQEDLDEEEVDDMDAKFNQLLVWLDQNKAETQELSSRCAELQEKNSELESERSSIRGLLAASQNENLLLVLKRMLESALDRENTLLRSLEQKESQSKQLAEEVAYFKDSLGKVENDAIEKCKVLEEQVSSELSRVNEESTGKFQTRLAEVEMENTKFKQLVSNTAEKLHAAQTELSNAQSYVSEKQLMQTELQNLIANLQSENEELKSMIVLKDSRITQIQVELSALQTTRAEMSLLEHNEDAPPAEVVDSRFEDFSKALDAAVTERNRLTQDRQNLCHEIMALNDQLQLAQGDIDAKEIQIESLNEANAAFLQQVETLKQSQRTSEVAELQDIQIHLQLEKTKLDEKVTELEEENQLLRHCLNEAEQSAEERGVRIEELDLLAVAQKGVIVKLREQLELMESTLASLKQHKEDTIADIHVQKDQLESDFGEVHSKLDQMVTEAAAKEKELETLRQTVIAYETFSSHYTNLQTAYSALYEEHQNLLRKEVSQDEEPAHQVTDERKENIRLKAKVKKLQTELSKVSADLSHPNEETENRVKKLRETYESQLSEKQNEIEGLIQHLQAVRSSYEDGRATESKFRLEIQDVFSELSSLKEEKESLLEEFSEFNISTIAELKVLQDQVTGYSQHVLKFGEKKDSQQELISLRATVKKLQEQIANSAETIELKSEELAALKNMYYQLEAERSRMEICNQELKTNLAKEALRKEEDEGVKIAIEKLDEAETRIADLLDDVQRIEMENNDLVTALKNYKRPEHISQSTESSSQSVEIGLTEEASQTEEIDNVSGELQLLRDELQRVSGKLEEEQEYNDQLKEEIVEWKRKNLNDEEKVANFSSIFESEKEDLLSKIYQLQQQIDSKLPIEEHGLVEEEKTTTSIKKGEETLSKYSGQAEEVEASALLSRISELEDDKRVLQEQLAPLHDLIAMKNILMDKLTNLEETCDQIHEERRELIEKIETVERQLVISEQERLKIHAESSTQIALARSSELQLREALEKIRKKSGKGTEENELSDEEKRLTEELQNVSEELDEIKWRLTETEEQKEEVLRKLANKDSELKRIQNEFYNLEKWDEEFRDFLSNFLGLDKDFELDELEFKLNEERDLAAEELKQIKERQEEKNCSDVEEITNILEKAKTELQGKSEEIQNLERLLEHEKTEHSNSNKNLEEASKELNEKIQEIFKLEEIANNQGKTIEALNIEKSTLLTNLTSTKSDELELLKADIQNLFQGQEEQIVGKSPQEMLAMLKSALQTYQTLLVEREGQFTQIQTQWEEALRNRDQLISAKLGEIDRLEKEENLLREETNMLSHKLMQIEQNAGKERLEFAKEKEMLLSKIKEQVDIEQKKSGNKQLMLEEKEKFEALLEEEKGKCQQLLETERLLTIQLQESQKWFEQEKEAKEELLIHEEEVISSISQQMGWNISSLSDILNAFTKHMEEEAQQYSMELNSNKLKNAEPQAKLEENQLFDEETFKSMEDQLSLMQKQIEEQQEKLDVCELDKKVLNDKLQQMQSSTKTEKETPLSTTETDASAADWRFQREEFEERIQVLKSENKLVEQKMSSIFIEKDEMQRQINQLQHSEQELQTEKEKLQHTLETVKAENMSMLLKLQSVSEEENVNIAMQKAEIAKLEKEKMETLAEVQNKEEAISSVREQVLMIQHENSELVKSKQELQIIHENTKKELDVLNKEIQTRDMVLDELRVSNQKLNEDLAVKESVLESELCSIKQKFKEEEQLLLEEILHINNKLSALEDEKHTGLSLLKNEIMKAESENENLQKKLLEKEEVLRLREMELHQIQMNQSEMKLKFEQAQHVQSSETESTVQAEKEALKSKLDAKEFECSTIQAELKVLKAKEEAALELESEKLRLTTELKTTIEEQEHLRTDVFDLQRMLEDNLNTKNALENQLQVVVNENKDLKLNVEKANQFKQQLNDEIERIKIENQQRLSDEISSRDKKIEDLLCEIAKCQSLLAEHEAKTTVEQRQIERLNSVLKEHEDEKITILRELKEKSDKLILAERKLEEFTVNESVNIEELRQSRDEALRNNGELKEQVNEMERRINTTEFKMAQIEVLSEQLKESERTSENLKLNMDKANISREQMQDALTEAKVELESVIMENTKLRDKVQLLNDELRQVSSKLQIGKQEPAKSKKEWTQTSSRASTSSATASTVIETASRYQEPSLEDLLNTHDSQPLLSPNADDDFHAFRVTLPLGQTVSSSPIRSAITRSVRNFQLWLRSQSLRRSWTPWAFRWLLLVYFATLHFLVIHCWIL